MKHHAPRRFAAFPIVAMTWLLAQPPVAAAMALTVDHLRCEYLENPLGIDSRVPRLSWKLETGNMKPETDFQNADPPTGSLRGVRQTAYQVLVASSDELLMKDTGDLWDSGKVASNQSIQVEYAGKPLQSRMRCYWKVRTWTTAGTAWSKPAAWSMGLLDKSDWRAAWIGLEQVVAAKAAGSLIIRRAVFQSVDGEKSADVTATVAALVKHGVLVLKADNQSLGGDPAPNKRKQLHVEYELDGKPGSLDVAEGEHLAIPDNGESNDGLAVPRYLRKPFAIDKEIRRATAYVTALGLYELRLNGARVGDHLLSPEWTNYHKRVQYQTYDVSTLVRKGNNAVAMILGNGWYCGNWQHWESKLRPIYGDQPYAHVQLEIESSDGSVQTVVSDGTWRGTNDGPIRFSGIYEGETCDARKEMPGWDTASFDDQAWRAVTVVEPKSGNLVWQRGEPIRATRELKPVALAEPKPGIYVFAFDQNMVGWCRFTLRGKAGDTVELQHGEICNPDGTVFIGNLCVVSEHRAQLDRYTFRGDGVETFEPHFTYHGFRYVEVRGLKEKPSLESLTGVVFHSACPEVGRFTCSEPLLNRLALNILWSQRGNYMGVPTDCPQRNERCGYTGDAQFFMRAAVYNMDVSAFFNRWLVDVCEDAQMPDGHFADHAPTFGPGDGPNIGWSDAGIICPYEIYRNYGDTRVISEHYAAMKRNLDWLARESRDDVFKGKVGNGDWLSTGGGACNDVIGTAYSAFDCRLMAEMAEAIGEQKDAVEFRDRADRIAGAFAKAYIDADGHIKDSSQSGYALAFTMGLVPAPLIDKMTGRFVDEVRKFDWHPRTGFIGTPRLLPGLHLAGRDDDAYRLLLTKTAPSWLYPVTVGATTIWEQWVAWDGKNPQGGMNSHNHYAFGAVGEYLFGMVGGIQPGTPGYQTIRIAPVIREGLTWAKTRYDSIYGVIETAWKLDNGRLALDVTIPPNTTATVHVPAKTAAGVTESGKPAANSNSVKFLRLENGTALYEVGSGCYRFQSTLP